MCKSKNERKDTNYYVKHIRQNIVREVKLRWMEVNGIKDLIKLLKPNPANLDVANSSHSDVKA